MALTDSCAARDKLMAEAKKPVNAKAIVDVAQPGKSAPVGNSKSVIVSNRPILKDPMMVTNDTAPANDKPAEDPLVKASDNSGPQPLGAPVLEDEKPVVADANESPAKAVAKELTEAGAAANSVSDKPKTDGPTTEKPEETTETAGEDAEAAKSKDEDIKQLEAEATEQAKHQEVVDKLADSKKYYLPINTVEKRRSRHFVVLGVVLSLLLIVAWADIALDAGLVKAGGIKPLTHFFSN